MRDFDFSKARPLGIVVGGVFGLTIIALIVIGFAALLRLTGALIGFPFQSGTQDIRGIGFLLAAIISAPLSFGALSLHRNRQAPRNKD
ncbi:MAG: hypothetical protein Q9M48_13465 [Rhodobacterales bacterium]|nr:hypothetical protein [Rhodobacterales bacterium]